MNAGPGSVLGGRYELIRPLAAGGMGTVWLGRHLELETEVAIKLVEGPLAQRPDLLERFRREARAAAQLKTPHVVSILDYGTEGGTPYIAMELLEGEDLEALLARERTLSPARVAEILRPLCRALEMAHTAGIVHRDLKPANVFVARVAGDEVIKLVDFGIAKELNRGSEHTTGAAVVGSPLFMSPEQIDEKSAVDARTDVWSLGVMAHLMLAGTTPFVATTIASILYKIVYEPLELPSVHTPALAPFDAFFTRALSRPQHERYATVSDLMAGFDEAVAKVDAPTVAIPSASTVHATSATLPMRTSEAPRPDAFVAPDPPPPSAGVVVTDPAAPAFVADVEAADGPPVSSAPAEVEALAVAAPVASSVAAPVVAASPPASSPASAAGAAGAAPSSPPWTWIVGGGSIAVGAIAAIAVLATRDPQPSTEASATPSASVASPRAVAAPARKTPPRKRAASAAPDEDPDDDPPRAMSASSAVSPSATPSAAAPPAISASAAPSVPASATPSASARPQPASPPSTAPTTPAPAPPDPGAPQ